MTITHASYTLTRHLPHPPARVFHAFADEATKRRWATSRSGGDPSGFTLDFRVDGRESSWFHLPDTDHLPPHVRCQRITNEGVFHHIEPDQRIVYSYSMTIGGVRMSVSLVSIELTPTATGTRLVYSEQGAWFENADDPTMRESGWEVLLDHLGKLLDHD